MQKFYEQLDTQFARRKSSAGNTFNAQSTIGPALHPPLNMTSVPSHADFNSTTQHQNRPRTQLNAKTMR